MKIAIVGTDKSGKSTLAKHMQLAWPMYKEPDSKYLEWKNSMSMGDEYFCTWRDLATDSLLHTDGEHIIYEDNLLNNMAEMLWQNELGNISDDVVEQSIMIFRQSVRFYDLILFLSLDPEKTPIPTGELTDTEKTKRQEVENYLLGLYQDWYTESPTFFVAEDRPPFVKVWGEKEEIVYNVANDFLDKDGNRRTYSDTDLQDEMAVSVEEYARWKKELGGDDSVDKIIKNVQG